MTDHMTTVRVAAQMNAVLGSNVYDDRLIREEINLKRLRAFGGDKGSRRRRRWRITQEDFLRWAATVLRADELHRLRVELSGVSRETTQLAQLTH